MQAVIVLGSVRIRADQMAAAWAAAREHVARSRQEPGCLEHGVYRDADDEQRLVFIERWSDLAALHVHFAVPASIAFVRGLARLADGKPRMTLYEAREVAAPGGGGGGGGGSGR